MQENKVMKSTKDLDVEEVKLALINNDGNTSAAARELNAKYNALNYFIKTRNLEDYVESGVWRKLQITDTELENLLKKHKGNVNAVAADLGHAWDTVNRRALASPGCKALIVDVKEGLYRYPEVRQKLGLHPVFQPNPENMPKIKHRKKEKKEETPQAENKVVDFPNKNKQDKVSVGEVLDKMELHLVGVDESLAEANKSLQKLIGDKSAEKTKPSKKTSATRGVLTALMVSAMSYILYSNGATNFDIAAVALWIVLWVGLLTLDDIRQQLN